MEAETNQIHVLYDTERCPRLPSVSLRPGTHFIVRRRVRSAEVYVTHTNKVSKLIRKVEFVSLWLFVGDVQCPGSMTSEEKVQDSSSISIGSSIRSSSEALADTSQKRSLCANSKISVTLAIE